MDKLKQVLLIKGSRKERFLLGNFLQGHFSKAPIFKEPPSSKSNFGRGA
jgi:hypothetical protein